MAQVQRRNTDDVPDEVAERLRKLCLALPDAYEERAWVGTRWMVRKKTFAHVLGVETDESAWVVLTFRSQGEELETLRHVGYPYYVLEWGRHAMGMVIDHDTDWEEVREIVTESFCLMAPKKLVILVDRPDDP